MAGDKNFPKDTLSYKFGLGITGGLLALVGGKFLSRYIVDRVFSQNLYRIMTDPYTENMWEFVSASSRAGLQTIVETNLRSEKGKVIGRPFGSPRKFPDFDNLLFNIAQLDHFPTPGSSPIDTQVVLGKMAGRPLMLDIPIIISGMAYGLALSEKAKIGLAKGAAMAGTATNTGEGPFLSSERKAAKYLIIQYNRGNWNKEPEILKQADMIEIQLGQGASGGVPHVLQAKDIDANLRRHFGLKKGEEAVIKAWSDLSNPRQLKNLVHRLRSETEGVPICVKMGAGKYMEKDLEFALDAGVDVVAFDGAQAGTHASSPILQDDFGIPTLIALNRAADFLSAAKVRNRVSLIISGGLFTPGHFLKALALGADAVYIGTMAVYALSHTQVLKPLPWEPPTDLVYYDGKFQNKLDVEQAAKNLCNFLKSCTEEMAEGVRALGKTAFNQVNKEDLVSLDPIISESMGIDFVYQPPGNEKGKGNNGNGSANN
ncbi:MAG: FMN-binding glutamate synthase family protein [Bacillota bacterium]